jgi:NADH-quinone oxidoreductase subunit G
LAGWIAEHTGASVGYLGGASNAVGAELVRATPGAGGLNAGQMLASGSPVKALLLLNAEMMRDSAHPVAARAALEAAEMVVLMSPFKPGAHDVADVALPVAPFTETSGSFVSAEGRVQSFHGVVKPLAETRPAWKVLRVLANLLELPGFDFESTDDVRSEALGDLTMLSTRLDNRAPLNITGAAAAAAAAGLERIANVPIYDTDAVVRRAPALKQTADAKVPPVGLPTALWSELGLKPGAQVRVSQGTAQAVLTARLEAGLAAGTVRVAAGHPDTASLGPMFGALTVERA